MIFIKGMSQIVLAFVISVAVTNCSKKSDDSTDDSADVVDTSGTGGDPESSNALALIVPDELSFSAFSQSVGTSLRLEEDKTLAEKTEENREKLSGNADSCFDAAPFRRAARGDTVNCYEFDSDMNPSEFAGQSATFGTTDGKDENGEACLVAFARSQMKDIEQIVDHAMAIIQGMVCQNKKDGGDTEPPAEGETKDLADAMESAAGDDLPVSVAEVEGLAPIDDNPVFRTYVEIDDPNGNTMKITLVNTRNDSGDQGILSFERPARAGQSGGDAPQNDPNQTDQKTELMSVAYQFDGETNRMKAELRRAMINNDFSDDFFTDEGLVNYAAVPDEAQNSDIHAIKYVAFDMDPDTNEGSLSYWMNPGGNYNESARGFLFNIEKDESDALGGCGVSGATSSVSVRKHLATPSNELAPVRYWHPRGNQNISADKDPRYNTGNEGNLITSQCFLQGSDGVYAIDDTVTTHERGYDVIAGSASTIEPPPKPENLDGDFRK